MIDILTREISKIIGENKQIDLDTGEVYYEFEDIINDEPHMVVKENTLSVLNNMYDLIEHFEYVNVVTKEVN